MKYLLIVLLTAFLSLASDIEMEIRTLIEEVKKAPPEERYKVMNRLKLKLRELSTREREEAIKRVYMELKGERHREKHELHEEKVEERHERHEEKMEKIEERMEMEHEEKEGMERGMGED